MTFAGRTGDAFRPAADGVTVTQVYCSAMGIGYAGIAAEAWEVPARTVLDAVYEATLWAAVLNARRTGVRTVFLTFVGGGVFRNPMRWIADAIGRAVRRLADAGADLDVRICHYRLIDGDVRRSIDEACRGRPSRKASSSR